jgi:hypothetical protein
MHLATLIVVPPYFIREIDGRVASRRAVLA